MGRVSSYLNRYRPLNLRRYELVKTKRGGERGAMMNLMTFDRAAWSFRIDGMAWICI
jgi:hypothetical protein